MPTCYYYRTLISCPANSINTMSEKRIITCPECGHKFPVTESSAGETLPCPACQRNVTLPTLLELRQLPVQPNEPVQTKEVSDVDRRLGVIVLLSAIALVFLALAVWWGMAYYDAYNNIYAIEYKQWDVTQTWTEWQFIRPGVDTPLTETEQYLLYSLRMLWKWLVIYISIFAICVAGIIYLWVKPVRKIKK